MEDMANYACKCNELITSCVLTVEQKKVRYHFNQKLPEKAVVVRNKDLNLECSVSDPRAHVTWYKNGEELQVRRGFCSLTKHVQY